MSPQKPTNDGLRPAVFLDRDGTINRELDYLAHPRDLSLLPGAAAAIARLNRAGYLCVVVTNQSGIARGKLNEADLASIHVRLDQLLAAEGARIDRYGYCPHHPEIGEPPYRLDCECRKPRPGLLREAQVALGIDLGGSWVIGDSSRDLDAGAALEVQGILVETGKPVSQEARARYSVLPDLGAAVDRILG